MARLKAIRKKVWTVGFEDFRAGVTLGGTSETSLRQYSTKEEALKAAKIMVEFGFTYEKDKMTKVYPKGYGPLIVFEQEIKDYVENKGE